MHGQRASAQTRSCAPTQHYFAHPITSATYVYRYKPLARSNKSENQPVVVILEYQQQTHASKSLHSSSMDLHIKVWNRRVMTAGAMTVYHVPSLNRVRRCRIWRFSPVPCVFAIQCMYVRVQRKSAIIFRRPAERYVVGDEDGPSQATPSRT